MRPILLIAATALALPLLLPAQSSVVQKNDLRQRLERLEAATSLDREGTMPWHLRMAFELRDLTGKKKETGTIEEWWVNPQLHKLVIDSPSYKFNDRAPAPTPPFNRQAYLIRALLNQVVHPIPAARRFRRLQVVESIEKMGKTNLACLAVSDTRTVSGLAHVVEKHCVEPGTTALRLTSDEYYSAVRNNVGTFQDVSVAADNTLHYGAKVILGTDNRIEDFSGEAITGHVEVLEAYVPHGRKEDFTPTVPERLDIPRVTINLGLQKSFLPRYPPWIMGLKVDGTVLVCAVLAKDGTIAAADVVSSANASLSQLALETVRSWRYYPYTVDDAPAEIQTLISVSFERPIDPSNRSLDPMSQNSVMSSTPGVGDQRHVAGPVY